MSATRARGRRKRALVRPLLVLSLLAGVTAVAFVARERPEPPPPTPPTCSPPAACVAALDGGQTLVSTRGAGAPDATLEPAADGSVTLMGLDGHRRWRVATGSDTAPELLAAGDVGADGVTDYVLGLTHALTPARSCGTGSVARTSLTVVDGRTGETQAPFGSLRDVCWNTPTFNYPTRQWSSGTVYIGDFTTARRGPEVVVLPYYAKRGRVFNLAEAGDWELVRTASASSFAYPSTAAFDRAYRASNPTPCMPPGPGGPCYTENSHVANAVFPANGTGGLFVLTSSRAVVYRPDLTPTSDLVWWPGGVTDNGGRNYGLVETYRSGGATYVDLIGGCSTLSRWRALASGDPTGGDANCGVARHFERFRLSGSRIAQHESRYYGYAGTHGALDGRVEFPARPHAALGGPETSWAAFNLLRSGTWTAQVYPGPASTEPMQLPGWYVWDTVELDDGGAALLASRVTAGSLVPAWELDVLRWDGSTFASVQHAAGVVPVLLAHASTPTRHTSETSLYGAYVGPGAARDLLVVDAAGKRRYVSLAGAG